MQFTAAILALAAAVSAAPDLSARGWCTFGEYDCSKDGRSIKQCDISGNWVEIGACPEGDYCGYSDQNDLPYCFGPNKKEKRGGAPPYCATPGTYTCNWDESGINVCNTQNQLVLNGKCPSGSHCEPLAEANYIPFCVAN